MATGTNVKYPKIKVKLVGSDSNAFAVLGKVKAAMRKENLPQSEIDSFVKEATNGDYSNLLATCMKWVNVS